MNEQPTHDQQQDESSHDDSISKRCQWWAECFPQHTKVETTQ